MRDIIQKIISTENEAKLLVEAARTEADHIVSDAQKKGQEIIERARQEAYLESEKNIEAAVEGAEEEKRRRLALVAEEIEREIQLDQEAREQVIEGVVRCVCGLP